MIEISGLEIYMETVCIIKNSYVQRFDEIYRLEMWSSPKKRYFEKSHKEIVNNSRQLFNALAIACFVMITYDEFEI